MKTTFLAFLLLLTFIFQFRISFSQTCPPNIDFEFGDFRNWDCFTGFTRVQASSGLNQIVLNPTPPTPGRHEIISAASPVQIDPYGKFPTLCPYGGNYSVKLGNDRTGAEAEGLSYTFQVPVTLDTFTFTYFYAVVFENPNHPPEDQPRFFVTAYDVATGDLVNCASYNYVSSGNLPGFKQSKTNPDVLYKEWTPTSLQFAGLAGRTVRLEFKTADCTQGAHFGYAYLDISSGCSNILATAPYCREANSLILDAPYGFQDYIWYNSNYSTVIGKGQSVTLSPPPVTSGMFYVDVIPYPGYGCRDTLQAIVTPLPVPDTPVAKSPIVYCQNQTSTPLAATTSPGNVLIWYTSPTGGIGDNSAPTPVTSSVGEFDYYVTQKVLFGCESNRKKITVKVSPTPVASFKINAQRQCQNNNLFVLTSTSSNLDNPVYYWDFGDGSQPAVSAGTVTHTYASAGSYNVKLRVINDSSCVNEKTLTVTVVPKPVAAFSYPPIICEKQTPLTFTDNSSVPGGTSTITAWWWNIGGTIVQTKSPASATANTPGNMEVQLVVTTTEGCSSDTNKTIVNVHYRPLSQFNIGSLMCDNEIISFTDQSTISDAASSENIVKWQWTFDNSGSSSSRNPSQSFLAGIHKASLITETNYGCKSSPADSSFTIFPKPHISFTKNDSCVFKVITFSGNDLSGNVNKWYWNFGNGLFEGNSTQSKSFNNAGNYPITLLSYTTKGCKDTMAKLFTIYDNKASAGKDTVAAAGEPVQLNAKGGSNVSYIWSPADGLNNSAIENPIAILDRDQTYTLDAITDKGCESVTSVLIKRYAGPTIYIPSAFTPNSDSKNDYLKVIPVGIKEFKYFSIFNRFGELVYKSTDPTKGWDGKISGVIQPSSVFVVIAEAVDYLGRPIFKKGTVTLIR